NGPRVEAKPSGECVTIEVPLRIHASTGNRLPRSCTTPIRVLLASASARVLLHLGQRSSGHKQLAAAQLVDGEEHGASGPFLDRAVVVERTNRDAVYLRPELVVVARLL